MAIQVRVYSASPTVQAKKDALLARAPWPIIRDPETKARRIAMENVEKTRVYLVDPDGRACNCKAGQNGAVCCHRLAASAWAARERPAPLVRYEDLVPAEDEPDLDALQLTAAF